MMNHRKASLTRWVCATENGNQQRERIFIALFWFVNYLLATYDTKKIIANVGADVMNVKQREYMSAVRYSEVP